MDVANLRADCARCAALCCVALAFDRSSLFALDKPANEPCPNLGICGRCQIHADREQLGFSGCIKYDCLGAGQRVTQEVFGGKVWFQDHALLPRMLHAFASMRLVHELLLLLGEANKLPLSARDREFLIELEGALKPREGWIEDALAAPELGKIDQRVRKFLPSLQRHISVCR